MDEGQRARDAFYWTNGPCCSGCDWWGAVTSSVGECRRSAPMAGETRAALLGIAGATIDFGAGHALTKRGHHCGEFTDRFDWQTLPLAYRRSVGCPL